MAALVVASHALLDTLTDGGLGCALFWPFDLTRYFAPWTPLPVSPIGLGYLSPYGLYVATVELVGSFRCVVRARKEPDSAARSRTPDRGRAWRRSLADEPVAPHGQRRPAGSPTRACTLAGRLHFSTVSAPHKEIVTMKRPLPTLIVRHVALVILLALVGVGGTAWAQNNPPRSAVAEPAGSAPTPRSWHG